MVSIILYTGSMQASPGGRMLFCILTSSSAMKQAVTSGLLAAGAESFDAGVLPTPTLALAAKEFDAGVMITASHNPPEYNGIKLLNPDGSAFDSNQQEEIEVLAKRFGVEGLSGAIFLYIF